MQYLVYPKYYQNYKSWQTDRETDSMHESKRNKKRETFFKIGFLIETQKM